MSVEPPPKAPPSLHPAEAIAPPSPPQTEAKASPVLRPPPPAPMTEEEHAANVSRASVVDVQDRVANMKFAIDAAKAAEGTVYFGVRNFSFSYYLYEFVLI